MHTTTLTRTGWEGAAHHARQIGEHEAVVLDLFPLATEGDPDALAICQRTATHWIPGHGVRALRCLLEWLSARSEPVGPRCYACDATATGSRDRRYMDGRIEMACPRHADPSPSLAAVAS